MKLTLSRLQIEPQMKHRLRMVILYSYIPRITDEFAIGMAYDKLGVVLLGLERKMKKEEIAEEVRLSGEAIEYVEELIRRSEHMRGLPLTPQVN